MDVYHLASILAAAVASVSRDPIITDVYMDDRGTICFRCRGLACEALVYELGEAMEALTGHPVVVRRIGERLCFEPLETQL